ncbi:MAG: NUDIX hydrolase [Planctomycetes bacterium]|nr:NUDIX hydrolase [Planctomycetota bacterium]
MELRDAVVVVIRDDFGHLLLARRAEVDTFPGVWNLVTGAANPGENLVDACRRETKEEIGIDIQVTRKLWESTTSGAPFVLHWYEAQALSDNYRLDPTEVSALRWIAPEELQDAGLMFRESVEFLERYLKGDL